MQLKIIFICIFILLILLILYLFFKNIKEKFSDTSLLNLVMQNTQKHTNKFIQNSYKENGNMQIFQDLNGNILSDNSITVHQVTHALTNKFCSDDKLQYIYTMNGYMPNMINNLKTFMAGYINEFSNNKITLKTANDITLYDVIQGLNSPPSTTGVSMFGGQGFNVWLKDNKFFDQNVIAMVNTFYVTNMGLPPVDGNSITNVDILKMINYALSIAAGVPLEFIKLISFLQQNLFMPWYFNNVYANDNILFDFPSPLCTKMTISQIPITTGGTYIIKNNISLSPNVVLSAFDPNITPIFTDITGLAQGVGTDDTKCKWVITPIDTTYGSMSYTIKNNFIEKGGNPIKYLGVQPNNPPIITMVLDPTKPTALWFIDVIDDKNNQYMIRNVFATISQMLDTNTLSLSNNNNLPVLTSNIPITSNTTWNITSTVLNCNTNDILNNLIESGKNITKEDISYKAGLTQANMKPSLLVGLLSCSPDINNQFINWGTYQDTGFFQNYLIQNNTDPLLAKYNSTYFNQQITCTDISVALDHAMKNADTHYLDLALARNITDYFKNPPFNLNLRPEDLSNDQLIILINSLTGDPDLKWIYENICQLTLDFLNPYFNVKDMDFTELQVDTVTPDDVAVSITIMLSDKDPGIVAKGQVILGNISNVLVPKALQAVFMSALAGMHVATGILQLKINKWVTDNPNSFPNTDAWNKFFGDVKGNLAKWSEQSGLNKFLICNARKIALDLANTSETGSFIVETTLQIWDAYTSIYSTVFKKAFTVCMEKCGFCLEDFATWCTKSKASNFIMNGVKGALQGVLLETTEEFGTLIMDSLSAVGLAQIAAQVCVMLINAIAPYCPCDYPKKENHFTLPICYSGSCAQEFPDFKNVSDAEADLGLCAYDCGKEYGDCYYSNGTWCANQILQSGCITQAWTNNLNLTQRKTHVVVTDDPVCTWDSKSAACRLGYVESCSDITQQKISEIYDTMLNSHAFD